MLDTHQINSSMVTVCNLSLCVSPNLQLHAWVMPIHNPKVLKHVRIVTNWWLSASLSRFQPIRAQYSVRWPATDQWEARKWMYCKQVTMCEVLTSMFHPSHIRLGMFGALLPISWRWEAGKSGWWFAKIPLIWCCFLNPYFSNFHFYPGTFINFSDQM